MRLNMIQFYREMQVDKETSIQIKKTRKSFDPRVYLSAFYSLFSSFGLICTPIILKPESM